MFERLRDFFQGKPSFGGIARSPEWRGVRNDYLKRFPNCRVCNGVKKSRVHHLNPFHLFPELELVEENLITLCEKKKYGINCHLLIGHLGNWRRINLDCEKDASYWFVKLNTNKM